MTLGAALQSGLGRDRAAAAALAGASEETSYHRSSSSSAAGRSSSSSSSSSLAALNPATAGLSEDEARGLCGLSNLGNTCFMNSILQCLSNIPALRSYFTEPSGHPTYQQDLNRGGAGSTGKTQGELAQAFAELLNRMWRTRGGVDSGACERPERVKAVIGRVAPRFLGYDQHDAQEFLRFFLDGLHEDTNRVRGKLPYKELTEAAEQSDLEVSEAWWKYYCSRSDSRLRELFCGQLKTQVTCLECGRVSRAFDPFWDLSLPIPKTAQAKDRFGLGGGGGSSSSCSLSNCLGAFMEAETLEDSEAVYCSRCKAHTSSSKSMGIFRLPPVLVLHIKRFTFSTFRRTKLTTSVELQMTGLSMAPFCVPGSPASTGAGAGASYRLVGISNHSGSLGGGHYTADCWNADCGGWYNFNDSRVCPTSSGRLSGSAAYLLFYVRE